MAVQFIRIFLGLLFLVSPAWGVTRFYLPSVVGANTVSPKFGNAAWSDTIQANRFGALSTSKTGTIMSAFNVDLVITTIKDSILMGQWVSDPLDAQTISGTLTGQFRANESGNPDNATVAFALYVTSNNGDTLRGILANTKASDATTRPPELALTTLTNRQLQDQAENTSITLTQQRINNGDRLVFEFGLRENNNAAAILTASWGDDNATDLPVDNTTTAANNPWFELSQTLTFASADAGTQVPSPCDVHTGDTLFPAAAGQSNALTNGCGLTQANNWQCVDDTIDRNDGCTAALDSVYISSTTMTWDWYRIKANGMTLPDAWKRHNVKEQIDALAVMACCHFAGNSTTLFVQFALMDSLNGRDTVFSPIFASSAAIRQTFSYYFWQVDSASQAGGNKWFHPNKARWDSLSMEGLQIGLGMRTASAAAGRIAVCDNIAALVLSSIRDSTIPDSVSPNMARTTDTTGNTVLVVHPQGAWNSPLSNKERYWATSVDNAVPEKYVIVATDDTGKTWTYMNPSAGDTLHIRRSTDGMNTNTVGPVIFRDTSNLFPDSLYYGFFPPTTGNNKVWMHRSKAPSLTGSDWASAEVVSPAGRRDSVTRYDRVIAAVYCSFYSKGDTVWAATIDTSSGNLVGALKILRMVYTANALTVLDSSYVHGLPLGTTSYDADPQFDSISTGGTRRIVFTPWKNNYPALFVWGWVKDSARAIAQQRICFYRWHPSWDSSSYVAKRDSIKKYAWLRNPGTRSVDTMTIANITSSSTTNSGELAATTVNYSGSATGPVAHVVWFQAPFIYHQMVDSTFTRFSVNPGKVAELTADANGGNTTSFNISITHKDTLVYYFGTYYKSYASANQDTNTLVWALHCGGTKWRGLMPLFWTGASPARLQYKYPHVPPVQFNAHRILALSTMGSARASAAKQAVYSSSIIRGGNWAVAGAAVPMPARRRKIIIERNYRVGEKDEKDSIWQSVFSGSLSRKPMIDEY